MTVTAKRLLDLTICLLTLPFALPIVLFLGLVILLSDGWPVLFTQERIGMGERRFSIYKFRTMSNATDIDGSLLPDAARLTRLGRFIRTASLDELPQLWNVLRGEMSLVGPRPLPTRYLSRYSPRQRRRHLVRPGITGWAQVCGRNEISWEQKFNLDIWYLEHRNFALDLRILWMTLLRVLHRSGISQEGHATMPEFQGEEK